MIQTLSIGGLAFVFPGQGAQAVGMGRDLYDRSPAARAAFDRVDAACGVPVSILCFEGPEEALRETRNTQPALFAVSVATLAACAEAGLTPAVTAGHSVGEYAALVAAGALTVEDGARLVAQRSAAMAAAADAAPGAMAAVLGLDAALVAECCRMVNHIGVVVPANLNAPGQVVISGEKNAVAEVSTLLKQRGAKRVIPLAVSGAFHSPLMDPAADALKQALALAPISDPRLPVVANVTADYETNADTIRQTLAAQVAGPVRWTETIERLVGDGFTTFIECGPGSVLAGMIKRIAPQARTFSVSDSASLAAAREAVAAT